MLGFDPEIAQYLADKQQKQDFLGLEIVAKGYNQVEFAQYIDSKKVNGTDIDNWTMEELTAVVYEFQSYYGPVVDQPVEVVEQPIVEAGEPQAQPDLVEAVIASPQVQEEEKGDSAAKNRQTVNQEALFEIAKNKKSKPERQYIQTRKCDDVSSVLNFKRIDIQVQDGLVKEGGMFSASYPTYRVVTAGPGLNFDVRRKDADFYFLRKHLLRCFPHMIIPPCPKEQPKLLGDRIKKRERYYTRFMQAIARCEELKTSKFLLCFLQEQDIKVFQKIQKDAEKGKELLKSRTIEELTTIGGSAKVILMPGSVCAKFCTQLTDVVDNYQILNKEIISCSKDLTDKAHDFASTLHQMQRLMSQMCELQKRIQCPSQAQTFEHLAKVMTSTGVYVKNFGDMMNKSFAEYFKYNLHEGDTFRDLFTTRDTLFQAYQRVERGLFEKKEKLFKQRDPFKWGGFRDQAEILRLKDELLKDREAAFDYMLPKETQDVEAKRQELCFYSNQCWDEIRRVSKDNGQLLAEHFKDMGLLHCTQISSNASSWEEFLTYFLDCCEREKEIERKLIEGGVGGLQQPVEEAPAEVVAGNMGSGDGGSGGIC